MTDFRINLTDSGSRSSPMAIGTNNRLSIQVEATTWSTAVAELEWSLDQDQWDTFVPPIKFDSTTPGRRNLDVSSVKWVRMVTETTATGASGDVEVTIFPFVSSVVADSGPGSDATRPIISQPWHGTPEGYERLSTFGRQPDIDTTSDPEDVWDVDGKYTGFITSADTLDVVSDDADDTSGGNGAQTIRLIGLDASYVPLEEDVTMNGATPVTTSNSFFRLFKAHVLTAGSTETNEGTITIDTTAANTVMGAISPSAGQTLMAVYTIKASVTGYLDHIYAGLLNNTSTSAEIWFQTKEENAAWRTRFAFGVQSTGSGHVPHSYSAYLEIPEKTDIRLRVQEVFASNTAVFGGFDMFLGP